MDKQKLRFRLVSGFTLAELVVVVTILSILSTVGFMALSQYGSDAKDAAAKSNVRSVYTAISAESAVTGNSARYYVVHDPAYALTGSAIVIFDGPPVMLAGGDWNAPGTNYSAGNPDYAKLKLNKEKFKISLFRSFLEAFAAADPKYVLVGAFDSVVGSGSKARMRSFAQTAATLSSGTAVVSGDFPSPAPGSVMGLVHDPANSSSTGAFVDGMKISSAPGCSATTISGYSVGALASGQASSVSKSTPNGSVTATASCSFGSLSVSGDAVVCDSGYVVSGLSCVASTQSASCTGLPANASWNTVSSITQTWNGSAWAPSAAGAYNATASTTSCAYKCNTNYTWNGSSCVASTGTWQSTGIFDNSPVFGYCSGSDVASQTAYGKACSPIGSYCNVWDYGVPRLVCQ